MSIINLPPPDITPSIDIPSLDISAGEHLPHWKCLNAIYHISFRLVDSVPQIVLEKWLNERENLIDIAKIHGNEISEETKKRAQHLFSEKIEKYLDVGYGN